MLNLYEWQSKATSTTTRIIIFINLIKRMSFRFRLRASCRCICCCFCYLVCMSMCVWEWKLINCFHPNDTEMQTHWIAARVAKPNTNTIIHSWIQFNAKIVHYAAKKEVFNIQISATKYRWTVTLLSENRNAFKINRSKRAWACVCVNLSHYISFTRNKMAIIGTAREENWKYSPVLG